jgi:pyruvate dehydrogenase E1 component alpha subunit
MDHRDRQLRLDLFGWMALTRAFDDAMVAMWKQGRGVGGTFSQRGHEAISVGVAMATTGADVMAPMHRDLGAYLVRGMTPERIFANLLGKATGPSGGRDANLHGMGDLRLGLIGFISHIPQALPTSLGAAMALKYQGKEAASVTFVGDGGVGAGAFHEVLNMAALWKAPFVLIVENNQFAYSTPVHQGLAITDIAGLAAAYGVPGIKIDGNDVETVHRTAVAALGRARAGEGPSLIEATTMRMLGHAIHDGAEYVPAEVLERWRLRDPIAVHRSLLLGSGAATESELDGIVAAARTRIERAVAVAQADPLPDPATLTDGVYSS